MLVKIPSHQTLPIYQILATMVKELKALGLSNKEISTTLKIHGKTVMKGLKYLEKSNL
jgi:DNA-binding transcriptional regulator YhcF (GntR family)